VRDTKTAKHEDIELEHDLTQIVEVFRAFAKEEQLDFFA
jgi:hypothetical protein